MQRRDFLKTSLLGTAALGVSGTISPVSAGLLFNRPTNYKSVVPEIFEKLDRPESHYPAIVIGSGFGGSIAAYRLAQAGVKTAVLERGFRWPIDPYRKIHPNDFNPDGRSLWFKEKFKHLSGATFKMHSFGGILDVTEYEHIQVWRGACVGGGSKVFTGVMIQPQQAYFEEIFGDTVDFKEMQEIYYPRVKEMLQLSPMPNYIYNMRNFGHSRIWDEQVQNAGFTPERVDGIWNWDVVANEGRWFKRYSAKIGESNHGNSNGAKFDLSQNYLKYAEETGYANIYAGIQVKEIAKDDTTDRYLVSIEQIDPYGNVMDSYTISCDKLFLAAGSIGSTELLMKAREKNTLSDLNKYVGTGWGTNGDAAVIRSVSKIRGIFQASPCAGKIETVASNGMPVTHENWYALHVPVNVGVIGSLGMAMDMKNRADFRYVSQSDSVTLDWPENGNDDAVEALRELNDKIADANNVLAGVPLFADDVNASFTAHPLGGAILGKATDNYGRLKGYEGLYAIDASLINGSTGAVNPVLTISALAERNIEKILAEDF